MASSLTWQMPQTPEIPGLVSIYQGNVGRGRPLLADDNMRGRLDDLLVNGEDLQIVLAMDESLTKPADFDLDGTWSGTNGAVEGIARALTGRGPTTLKAQDKVRLEYAQQLKKYWIGDNLQFLTAKHREEWRESNTRILRIDLPMSNALPTPRQAMSSLGIDYLLDRLVATHETYGRVLGLGGYSEDTITKIAKWEKLLDRFLIGLAYHHTDDPEIHKLFVAPYEAALETARQRRRDAKKNR